MKRFYLFTPQNTLRVNKRKGKADYYYFRDYQSPLRTDKPRFVLVIK